MVHKWLRAVKTIAFILLILVILFVVSSCGKAMEETEPLQNNVTAKVIDVQCGRQGTDYMYSILYQTDTGRYVELVRYSDYACDPLAVGDEVIIKTQISASRRLAGYYGEPGHW